MFMQIIVCMDMIPCGGSIWAYMSYFFYVDFFNTLDLISSFLFNFLFLGFSVNFLDSIISRDIIFQV